MSGRRRVGEIRRSENGGRRKREWVGRRESDVGGERGRGRNRRGGGGERWRRGTEGGEEGSAGGVRVPIDDVGDGGGVLGRVSESSERGASCSQGAQLIEGLVVV